MHILVREMRSLLAALLALPVLVIAAVYTYRGVIPLVLQDVTNATDSERSSGALAFMHLPKCGGTSLWRLIHTQATKNGKHPFVLVPKGPHWMQISQEERDETDVFGSDHINYHTLLRSWPTRAGNAEFVTILRDPRQRLASHYFFVKKDPSHHTYPFVVNRTFAEFVRDISPGYYLQFFLPPGTFHHLEGPGGELRLCCFQQNNVEEVKALLRERFAVVGTLEQLNKTLEVLKCNVPWIDPAASIGHLMQTEHAMPPFDEEDMIRATSMDQELYDAATQLLHEQYLECQQNHSQDSAPQ